MKDEQKTPAELINELKVLRQRVTQLEQRELQHQLTQKKLQQQETERQQVGVALHESEERLRLALEAAKMGFWDWDMFTGSITWSQNHELLFGLAPRTFGGTFEDFFNRVYPEDQECVSQAINRALESRTEYSNQFRVSWSDGTLHWISAKGQFFYNEAGQAIRMIGVCMDMTESKQVEAVAKERSEALRVSEERFRMLLENVKDYAIMFLDREGQIVKWSAGAESILGYQETEILGKSGSCIFIPEDIEQGEDEKELNTAVTEGRAEDERWHVRKDGTRFWGSGVVTALRDQSGQLQGFSKIMRDLTEQKQVEEERAQLLAREQEARAQAEAANRMKDDFLATLSHELRSPLNAMLGWTSLLRTRKFDEATTARAIETIERNAKAQFQLIEDLLDVSRIIRGQLRLNVRAMELVSVIESAVDTVRPAAEAKNIRLQLRLDSSVSRISADPDRLQQVFWNLLTNAVKFTPKGGSVQVCLQRVHSHIEISVSDTGQGISPDFLPYVFDRFRQADSSITRSYSGLGLGLAIVRHLVELHGGTVQAHSLGEGQGSRFIVQLPLMVIRAEASDSDPVQSTVREAIPFSCSAELHGLCILIVDDEADARELLIRILEQCGAKVTAVASAEEAFVAVQQLKPDILISDIGMPQEDGYSLIHRVRALETELGGRIPAVALTAYARAEDRKAALLAGFQSHVTKPVEPAELVAVIASLLGRTGN